MNPNLKKLGDKIKGYGIICAILWIGERYYMLKSDNGVVSLMPASLIENL